MQINAINNQDTQAIVYKTSFVAENVSEGTPLEWIDKQGVHDTLEISLAGKEASENKSPQPLIQVALDEVRGKYIDGKYVPAKYEVTLENFEEKLAAVTKEPQTLETMKAILGYAASFADKMGGSLFGAETDIYWKVNDLASEMIENNQKGIENSSENWDTTFTVEGVGFSFNELLNVSKAVKNINTFYHAGSFDYQAEAREAVVGAYLERGDTGFSSEQNNAIKAIFSKNVARWDDLEQDKINELDDTKMHNTVPELDVYFHGNGYNLTADKELVAKIKDIFQKVSSDKDFEEAVTRYGDLMKPLYEITEKLGLPYSNEYTHYVEKETVKNANALRLFWNSSLF